MVRRTTILLDDRIAIKLRKLQAKMIAETNSDVSYSQVINHVLKAGLAKTNLNIK